MTDQLTEAQREEFKEVFSLFDKDGSGDISTMELGVVMKALGQDPTEEELDEIIMEVDVNGDGDIDFEEFCTLMVKKMNESEPEEELVEVFKKFVLMETGKEDTADFQRDMKINFKCLQAVFKNIGEDDITEEQCKMMIEMHDIDGDGMIDFNDFVNLMMSK